MQRRELLTLSAALPVIALSRGARAETKGKPAPTLKPRLELLAALVETSSLGDAIKRFPGAALAPQQVTALEAITPEELAAVRSFQAKLARAKLPGLVLRRETIHRLDTDGGLAALGPEALRPSPPTNQAPKR